MPEKPTYTELEQKIRELEDALGPDRAAGSSASMKPDPADPLPGGISNAIRHGKSLQEREQTFKLIAEFTHSWEYWLGPDSKLQYVSPSCEKYTGYTQAEFMHRDGLLMEIIHPDDEAAFNHHVHNEQEGLPAESMEFRVIDRAGKTRWLLHTCQPIYDEKNRFLGRRASNREITDQKEAEQQRDALTENLGETSNLLNTVLDAIPDVIGVQDPDHNIIRYNRAGYEFLGMPPEKTRGKKCYELIGHSAPCRVCATTKVYQSKQVEQVEKYVPELDTWLDVRAYPILDDEGNIVQVIEHLRDISREKRAELELKEAQERLLTILDSIDAHVFVADLETYTILFMNHKMMHDFQADFVGQVCYESFRNETAPCDICNNRKLLGKTNHSTGVQTWESDNPKTGRRYLNFDRAIKWIDGSMVKIQIATDITEAKQNEEARLKMEQRLQQAQKYEAIGTLAGGIAHDFNNLLMGIQGWASLIAAELEQTDPIQEKVQAIEGYVRSATDLTKQILGFARGGKYEVRPIDINRLLSESAAMFARTRKDISIHTRLPEPLPTVSADKGQIEQVLLNLYVNAWQAMPAGGELILSTAEVSLDDAFCRTYSVRPDRYIKITVTDTGSGMDPETLQRAFDPFFTTKQKQRGTGLGLASAYGIVKNHAGIITADSVIGQGSTFCIYLPVSGEAVPAESGIGGGLLKGKETILLVDDEEMILEVAQAMLETLGYRVIPARGGQQAAEVVARQGDTVDLVILDLIMPKVDGAQTFSMIQEHQPQLPILLSSGYSIDGKAADLLQRGCSGFIQKPYDIQKLSQQVRKLLDGEKTVDPSTHE